MVIKDIKGVKVITDEGEITLPVDGYLDLGLYDTMEDLFVNFIGAVVFSVIGYFYVKRKGKGRIAKRFIPEVYE